MATTDRVEDRWTSGWGFVLAAAGSAIGLGNIWKFPYIAGEHGGGAFVLVYLLCIALIGVPVMMSEVLIGRLARRSPVPAFGELAQSFAGSKAWRWVGLIGLSAGFLVLSFYAVIAGWAVAYVPKLASGSLVGAGPEEIGAAFGALTGSPAKLLFWTGLIYAATIGVVAAGVNQGIERSVRWLMPIMFVILVGLVVYAALNGAFGESIRFLFAPDFSRLTVDSVLVALGHAFFTLSLAAGIMLMYGAYLPDSSSIPRSVWTVVFFDTLVALLAGMAIFPLVFANGLEPGSGPGLVFQTLPLAFAEMPMGRWIGTAFFVMLALAAFASTISLLEVVTVAMREKLNWSRPKAAFVMGVLIATFSVGTVLSFNLAAEWRLMGLNFFGLVDYLASNILLPLSGLLIAVFAAWRLRSTLTADALGWSAQSASFGLWRWVTRWIAPVLIGVVLVGKLVGAIN